MITGVTIGGYHSYDDLNMLLAKREIGLPEVQTSTVEVPGRDGALDLTDVLYGVKYDNRTIKLTLLTTTVISESNWAELLSDISGKLHGQKLKIIFDEDTDWYYYGRVSINKFQTDCRKQEVVLECDCEPYKLAVEDTVVEVTSPAEVTLICDRMSTIATLTTDATITLVYDSSSLVMSAGTYYLTGIPLEEGETTWTLTGTANVTITYTQGRL